MSAKTIVEDLLGIPLSEDFEVTAKRTPHAYVFKLSVPDKAPIFIETHQNRNRSKIAVVAEFQNAVKSLVPELFEPEPTSAIA